MVDPPSPACHFKAILPINRPVCEGTVHSIKALLVYGAGRSRLGLLVFLPRRNKRDAPSIHSPTVGADHTLNEESGMRKIVALIPPLTCEAVRAALVKVRIEGLVISGVKAGLTH